MEEQKATISEDDVILYELNIDNVVVRLRFSMFTLYTNQKFGFAVQNIIVLIV